jgi:SAM-dependent methyltransferase
VKRLLTDLARTILGVLLYARRSIKHRNASIGAARLYAEAQDGNKNAMALLTSPLSSAFTNYGYLQQALRTDGMSPRAVAEYADDALSGYGDWDYDKGGDTLETQQRGLILPLLTRTLESVPDKSVVLEIGTGNGDVIAHLADTHSNLAFVGVDLSVRTAQAKHGSTPNLDFRTGYALTMFEHGELRADVVFASSTFLIFTPAELARYLRAFRTAGVRHIVLNEPTWSGYSHRQDRGSFSRHLEAATWHHDYGGYLLEAGFTVTSF